MDNPIRPYYADNLAANLRSVYFSLAIHGKQNRDFWRGVLATIAALALAFNVNPDQILSADDAQLLRSNK